MILKLLDYITFIVLTCLLSYEGSSSKLEQTPVEKMKPNEPSCEPEDMEIIVTSNCGK